MDSSLALTRLEGKGEIMKAKVKIMPEYGASLLWRKEQVEESFKNVSPEELGLSSGLAEKVIRLNKIFEQTFDAKYPPNSGFADEAELNQFCQQLSDVCRQIEDEMEMDGQVELRLESCGLKESV